MSPHTRKTVVIDCFPENVEAYKRDFAIVAIDVIRATTTAVTAVAMGRRCYPVASLEKALSLAARMEHPLMVGEVGGDIPEGFHIPNSPAQVAQENDTHRPMILLSTSGTRVIAAANGSGACYAACLRNYTAQAEHLIKYHPKVAIIGAGTRGEFREEDQLCCAWIADRLLQQGYTPGNDQTVEIIRRWREAPVDSILISNSVGYLRRSGQLQDLDFVLAHIDDLSSVFVLHDEEIVMVPDIGGVQTVANISSEPKRVDTRANAIH